MAGKGGANPGAGRPKGSRNKRTLELQRQIEESGLTPLAYLLSVMRNEQAEEPLRLEAAKAAAPYVHSRLSSIEMKAEIEEKRVVKREPLTSEEWAQKRNVELPGKSH
jgi:hypothetical protein